MGGDKSSRIGGEMQVTAGILKFEFVELVLPVLVPEIDLAAGMATGTRYDHAVGV